MSKALSGFIVGSSSGQRKTGDEQEKRLYFEILDRFISELDRRFTDNDELLNAIQAFDCSSPHFMDVVKMEQFAQLYDKLIDTTLLSSQCHTAKAFLGLEMKDVEEEKTIMLAVRRLNAMYVAFSEVIKLSNCSKIT